MESTFNVKADGDTLRTWIASGRTAGDGATWTGPKTDMEQALAFVEAQAEPGDVNKIQNVVRVTADGLDESPAV